MYIFKSRIRYKIGIFEGLGIILPIMNKTVVINIVALSSELIGEHTPFLRNYIRGKKKAKVKPIVPAVTCSAQSTYVTGKAPGEHGAVGNGWYFKDECEIKFWRQSNKLVEAKKIWEIAKEADPSFTSANICWWYNMYSTVDYSVTPRPMYPADGRKIPDCYTHPFSLRDELQAKFGTFPLFKFWGPATTIESSQWIANAAKYIEDKYSPTLSFVYLPHLDYILQQVGINIDKAASHLKEIDDICKDLVLFFEQKGAKVILLSEYGITDVTRPIHLNRIFRKKDYIAYRVEMGREVLDAGASKVFAVADHQVAHIYLNDKSLLPDVRKILEQTEGIGEILDEEGKKRYGLDHDRVGDLVAIADKDSWFTYYYWLDDAKAPDYARTVDIHRKPGYDPVELFIDPAIKFPMLSLGSKVLKKKLGFRQLMDVTPLDATLVKGSHGRISENDDQWPIFVGEQLEQGKETIEAVDVFSYILKTLGVEKA
jgi:predicted AlkP superfamily pyrophosphatase or phosphodiesterase